LRRLSVAAQRQRQVTRVEADFGLRDAKAHRAEALVVSRWQAVSGIKYASSPYRTGASSYQKESDYQV
jgi:hypothetical protein